MRLFAGLNKKDSEEPYLVKYEISYSGIINSFVDRFPFNQKLAHEMLAEWDKYKGFLDDLTGAPGRWSVAVIAGPGPGPCSSEFGDASEAARLRDFVNMTGATGVFSSICEGDLATSLNQALETFDTACDNIPPIQ